MTNPISKSTSQSIKDSILQRTRTVPLAAKAIPNTPKDKAALNTNEEPARESLPDSNFNNLNRNSETKDASKADDAISLLLG